MLLQIDPSTPKGLVQLEAIGWAQDQINEILAQYFNNTYKVQRGLRIKFRLGLDLKMNEKVKVDIDTLQPKTEEDLDKALVIAKENWKMEQPVEEPKKEDKKEEVVT